MARTQKRTTEPEDEPKKRDGGSHAIWKGSITFGLVNIPVSLHAAESRNDISLHLLHRQNLSPIHYKRVDEATGKEVDWSDIVHGYEYEPGKYVVVSDEDLKRANPEATQTVEIVSFVDASEVSPLLFDKPYYLVPEKRARKSYALLREVLRRSGKYGIAKIVLRSREYIAAVLPQEDVIVVNLLRYGYELRDPQALDVPGKESMGEGEIRMAERLVDAMVEHWDPDKYRDTYHEDLLKMIHAKMESGETAESAEPAEKPVRKANVVDIMDLLKKSVEQAKKPEPSHHRKRKAS
jgi:DNA end-binding protein Ku